MRPYYVEVRKPGSLATLLLAVLPFWVVVGLLAVVVMR